MVLLVYVLQWNDCSTRTKMMQQMPGASDSPRPSSVGSTQSTHSSVSLALKPQGRGKNDICVGEELKIAVGIALERFRLSEEQKGVYNCLQSCIYSLVTRYRDRVSDIGDIYIMH